MDELYHHGVKGMKWGVRRSPAQLGHKTTSTKKKSKASKLKKVKKSKKIKTSKPATKKPEENIKKLSDDELRAKISRLELEKRYKDLSKTPKVSKRGKDFVMNVLEASGKNIATQLTTYAMGTAINKIFKADIVNPKKGQKDK